MKKVVCTLPNASCYINGVAFTNVDGAMVSEPVSDAVAELFLSIPGYEPAEKPKAAKPEKLQGKATAAPSAPVAPPPADPVDDDETF